MEVHAGDIVEATMTPARTDDLTPEAQRIVGQRFRWTAARYVDDGYPYEGQWRMELGRDDYNATGVRWAPLCDLSDLTLVGVDSDVAELAELHAVLHNPSW